MESKDKLKTDQPVETPAPVIQTKDEIKREIMKLRDQIPIEECDMGATKVWVHGLSSYDLEEWRLVRNSPEDQNRKLSTAKLIQLAVRDSTGRRIFEPNEITMIAGWPALSLEPVSRVAMRLSGYGVEAEAAILKNLLETHGGNGSSERPENTSAQ